MKFIERSFIIFYKKIQTLFLKHTSYIILYFYLILILTILRISFQASHVMFGLGSILYILAFLSFQIIVRSWNNTIYKRSIIILSSIVIISLFYFTIKYGYMGKLSQNIKVIIELIYNGEPFDFRLIEVAAIFIILGLVIIILFLDKKALGEITVLLFSIIALHSWIYGFYSVKSIFSYLYVLLSILYLVVNTYRKKSINSTKQKIKFSAYRENVIIHGILLSLIILFTDFIMIKAVGINSLNEIIAKSEEKIIKYGDAGKKSVYDISYSGLGNKEKLGGPINLNKGIAFRVKSDKPYYLRGVVKDSYDGHRWISKNNNYYLQGSEGIFTPDMNYTKYRLSENENYKNPSRISKNITVYPEGLVSSTLFTPYNTYKVKAGGEKIAYTFDRIFLLINKNSPDSFYDVNFFEGNNDIENIINIRNGTGLFDYESGSSNEDEINYYKHNVKDVYGSYMTLPANISKETYDLVRNVVKGCNSNEERVLKIYDYLKNNYEYSLDVSSVPEGREFVDYFLFTEKKGYCTYFATTAAVFCRIAGIPSRYVEGFSMEDWKDQQGLYLVSNERAHAWCEILLSSKNDIWIPIDCTPLQQENTEDRNIQAVKNTEVKQWMRKSSNVNMGNIYYQNQIRAENSKVKSFYFFKQVLFAIPVILIAVLFFFIVYKVQKYLLLKRSMLSGNSVTSLYYYSKHRLKTLGIKSSESCSELEFLQNINDQKLKTELYKIICIYNEEFYGEKTDLSFDKNMYYDFIEKYIRKKQNIFSYYICKYLIK